MEKLIAPLRDSLDTVKSTLDTAISEAENSSQNSGAHEDHELLAYQKTAINRRRLLQYILAMDPDEKIRSIDAACATPTPKKSACIESPPAPLGEPGEEGGKPPAAVVADQASPEVRSDSSPPQQPLDHHKCLA